MLEYKCNNWFYNGITIKNLEKIISRFRPKIKTKLYTKNNNFEMVMVVKLMVQHGVEVTYEIHN